jgi:hypothetical protein
MDILFSQLSTLGSSVVLLFGITLTRMPFNGSRRR